MLQHCALLTTFRSSPSIHMPRYSGDSPVSPIKHAWLDLKARGVELVQHLYQAHVKAASIPCTCTHGMQSSIPCTSWSGDEMWTWKHPYTFLSWIAQSHLLASEMGLRYSAQKCVGVLPSPHLIPVTAKVLVCQETTETYFQTIFLVNRGCDTSIES